MAARRSARTTKSGRLFGSSSQPGGEGGRGGKRGGEGERGGEGGEGERREMS